MSNKHGYNVRTISLSVKFLDINYELLLEQPGIRSFLYRHTDSPIPILMSVARITRTIAIDPPSTAREPVIAAAGWNRANASSRAAANPRAFIIDALRGCLFTCQALETVVLLTPLHLSTTLSRDKKWVRQIAKQEAE